MKKTLLTGALIAATAMSMSAAGNLTLPTIDKNVSRLENVAKPQLPSRARMQQTKDDVATIKYNDMFWGYVSSYYNATTLNGTVDKLMVAIQMPAEETKLFAGARVTAIWYPTGTAQNSVDEIATDVTAWIANDLGEAYVSSQPATFEQKPGAWNNVHLDNPYTIVEGQPFYAGIEFNNLDPNALPIMFSYSDIYNDYGCYIGYQVGSDEQWMTAGDQIGYLPVLVTLEGDNLPQNVVRLYGITVPSVASMGSTFTAGVVMQNVGAAPVTSMSMSAWTIGSDEPEPLEIGIGGEGLDPVPDVLSMNLSGVSPTAAGQGEFCISISGVNGEPNTLSNMTTATAPQLVLEEGIGYTRYSVFEDATGTWCGYCPGAYAIMEDMRERYADKGFIGIGVHAAQGANYPDPMDVVSGQGATYSGITKYIGGFPTILMNREYSFAWSQGEALEEALIDTFENTVAPIKVDAEIVDDGTANRITVNTRTTSVCDFSGSQYLLSFVLTEDNVGPYAQTNYFSGGQLNSNIGGFDQQPSPVYLMFNDVARYCNTFDGIRNSLPATITANEVYEYSTRLSLNTISDRDQYAVTVMIIDQKTGTIANACRVFSPTGGVEGVSVDTDNVKAYGLTGCVRVDGANDFEVYNMAGMRVNNANLPAGTYIVRAAGQSFKVLVK